MPDPASGIFCSDGVEGGFELCFQGFESACRFRLGEHEVLWGNQAAAPSCLDGARLAMGLLMMLGPSGAGPST